MKALGLLTLLALAGCVPVDVDHDGVVRIACLGDSITAPLWSDAGSGPNRWCEYAAAACPTIGGLPTQWLNYGIGGAAAGTVYSDYELTEAYAAHADAVVELFGVNNVGLLGQTPAQVATAVTAVCHDVFFTHARYCYGITLGPNVDPAYNVALVAAAQAQVGGTVQAAITIDGTTDLTVYDGTHLDDASEHALASRVAMTLGCVLDAP
jgi:hypothetical protein